MEQEQEQSEAQSQSFCGKQTRTPRTVQNILPETETFMEESQVFSFVCVCVSVCEKDYDRIKSRASVHSELGVWLILWIMSASPPSS